MTKKAQPTCKEEEQFAEVETVAVRHVPDKTMFLKQDQGNGTIDGKKFNLTTVIPGGSILVRFEDGAQFIVQHGDVCRAAYEAYRKVKGLDAKKK